MKDEWKEAGQWVSQNKKCWWCGSESFFEGPSGGLSTNMMCAGCRAKYNVSPFFVEVLEPPPTPEGALRVFQEEPELTMFQRWMKVLHEGKVADMVRAGH